MNDKRTEKVLLITTPTGEESWVEKLYAEHHFKTLETDFWWRLEWRFRILRDQIARDADQSAARDLERIRDMARRARYRIEHWPYQEMADLHMYADDARAAFAGAGACASTLAKAFEEFGRAVLVLDK